MDVNGLSIRKKIFCFRVLVNNLTYKNWGSYKEGKRREEEKKKKRKQKIN